MHDSACVLCMFVGICCVCFCVVRVCVSVFMCNVWPSEVWVTIINAVPQHFVRISCHWSEWAEVVEGQVFYHLLEMATVRGYALQAQMAREI